MFETKQAIIATIVLVLMLIVELVVFVMSNGFVGAIFWVMFVLLTLPLTVISILTVNCAITGGCVTFSWIMVALLILQLILYILLIVLALVARKNNQSVVAVKEKFIDKNKDKEDELKK